MRLSEINGWAEIDMVSDLTPAAIPAALLTEKEEVDLVPKRYRPDSINNLCTATGYVLV